MFGNPMRTNEKGSDPNSTYLSPDSATNAVSSVDAAQRNPDIGVLVVQFPPYFATLHTGYV